MLAGFYFIFPDIFLSPNVHFQIINFELISNGQFGDLPSLRPACTSPETEPVLPAHLGLA